MPFFKLNFHLSLFISAGLLLSACSIPSPQKRDLDQGATFFLDKSEGKFTSETTHEKFSIPLARTLSLKACFKTNLKSQTLINHDFEITGGATTSRMTTDANGCLLWDEQIEFNALADAQLILIERTAKAVGIEKGSRKIQLVINPWSKTVYALSDSRLQSKSYVSQDKALAALKGEGQNRRHSLWVDDLRVTSEERQSTAKGLRLNFEVRGALKYEHRDETGAVQLSDLSRGTFQARITLIHSVSENGKEVRRVLTAGETVLIPQLIGGALNFDSALLLEKICTRGQVQMGLSVEPVGAPADLRKFEGVFMLGECDQMKGSFFARLKSESARGLSDPTFSVESYVASASPAQVQGTPSGAATPFTRSQQASPGNNGEVSGPDTEYYQPARVEVREMQFTPAGFNGQRTIERERAFDVLVCMRMGLDQKGIRAQTFQVTKLNGQTVPIRTNDEGCLAWRDSLTYNVFAPECWSIKQVHLQNQNLGVDQKIDVLVNPWSETGVFARDLRYTDASARREQCASGESELLTNRYDFDKQKYEYDVDEFLNLEVRKIGPFKLNLRLKRPSLTNATGFSEESLPVGMYLLRLAVVDAGVRDFTKAQGRIYMVSEKAVPIRGNSTLAEDITLVTKNVKAIGNTNQILIEVLPLRQNAAQILEKDPNTDLDSLIDSQMKVKPLTYRGPLTMANNMEGGSLVVVENNGRSLIQSLAEQYRKDQEDARQRLAAQATPLAYAKENKLTVVNLHDEEASLGFRSALGLPYKFQGRSSHFQMADGAPVTTAQLKEALDKGLDEKLRAKLCVYWFADYWMRNLPGKDHGVLPAGNADFGLTMECHRRTRENVRAFFDIETKYFPKKARIEDADRQPSEGLFRDFNITQSFNLGHAYADTLTKTWSWDASLGLKLPEIPGLSLISGSTGVRYQVAKASAESRNKGTMISYVGVIALTVETLKFNLVADDYEKCLMIKLNPNLFVGKKTWLGTNSPFAQAMHPKLSPEEKSHYARSGLMICDGAPRGRPLRISENYYVLNQKLPAAQIMDNASDKNRPFFVTLRGEGDFVTFLSYLHNSTEIPSGYEGDFQRSLMRQDPTEAVFIRGVRNAPGVITAP
jgi:hypothetical protein